MTSKSTPFLSPLHYLVNESIISAWEAYTVQPYVEGRIKDKRDWVPWTDDFDSMGLQVSRKLWIFQHLVS